MKKILLLFAVLANIYSASAQTAVKTQQHVDYSRISGSFYYNVKSKGDVEHININYALYPAPFYTVVNLLLATAEPLSMKANIVNAAGKTVYQWKPEGISYKYETPIDISALPAGKYHVDVFAGDKAGKVYSIPFEKMAEK